MNTSYPRTLAASKIRSMFSIVLFSVTLAPTAPPIGSLLAQHVVLGVDKDYCCVDLSDFHGLLSMLAAQRSLPASGDAKWDPSPVVFNGGLALTRGKMRSERSRAMFERLKDCSDGI